MFSWIFALVHFCLYLGLLAYSIYSMFTGRWAAGLILLAFLAVYYFLVLHQAVLKEIKRKKRTASAKK
ncbi:MAG TPA: hypothetical protein PLP94_07375 [Candidatus Saccharicenans sp.]|jgi:hypothetical protein|nr:hypothetical protein [Candidatus Saccharicenans sp.]HOL45129.1 hypothetical protein [Candidatus Saccharicenans sp.]HOM94651.1 hypothetical protein [Candidatus Saccharicenans sp.]HOT68086.1 hypothetical protein [Candidatus Saccharicenans sp.]HPC88049.1 hypothetical protein [Candidatus Saccharicenans sp.]